MRHIVAVAIFPIVRCIWYLPVLEIRAVGRRRIRPLAAQCLAEVGVSTSDEFANRIAKGEGIFEHEVAARGHQADSLDILGNVTVFRSEAIVLDGTCHEHQGVDWSRREAVGRLQYHAGTEAV